MKIVEVVRRAQEDEKYALRLRTLAYKARDEGMESAAYRALTKDFVETPSDKLLFKTTMAYTMVLNVTASKFVCLGKYPTLGLVLGGADAAPTVKSSRAKKALLDVAAPGAKGRRKPS